MNGSRILPDNIENQVTRTHLQIAMYDTFFVMQICDTFTYLQHVISDFGFSNRSSSLMQLHHRFLPADFQGNINKMVILKAALKVDNVFVLQSAMELYLLCHLLLLVCFLKQCLWYNLPGQRCIVFDSLELVAFGEAAFSEKLSPKT